ncbi:MAG: methyl-accepting chemotaxis protein [Synergistaceae bacterium]|jgi:methyl-accepting chemotaxis protein|nr:methyl-accepting chemotaxis protein [Synergistaceae bacterium]
MWKNFKIRSKLLIGFGLLLVVFLGAVVVTWRSLETVRRGNEELAQAIVPIMRETSNLEQSTYEFLLSFRRMQYEQTEASFADVKAKEAVVQKNIDVILAFGMTHPTLYSIKYVQDKFVESYKDFADSVNKTIVAIRKKKERDLAAKDHGNEMTKITSEITTSYAEAATDTVITLDASKIEENISGFQKSMNILVGIQTLRLDMLRATSTNNARMMEEAHKEIPSFEKDFAALRDVSGNAKSITLLNQAIKATQNYAASLRDVAQGQKVFEEENNICSSLEQVMNRESLNAFDIAWERVATISSESVVNLASATMILLLSAAISLILGILIAILISRDISRPLFTIVTLAKRAEEGDLTIERKEFGYEGKDELGELADAISSMLDKQKDSTQQVVDLVGDLSTSANSLSAISEKTNTSMEEIKTSIEHVAASSENNSAALEECNAGIEEMSAGADAVAQSATNSAAFISQITNTSNKAIQMVNNVIVGMRNVNVNAKKSENKTRQLVVSVENVNSFVSVITGIADQTNLLALNAAIEAARAGEVGRGFAVVAEEVRKLAEGSARAARNVNGIIAELQSNAQESINATAEAGRMLMETLTQAEQTQGDLNEALQEMNKANDSIQNIAAVAEEQAASSREVAIAINSATKSTIEMVEDLSNIRRATEDTVQSARSVAEHSEAMSEHSQVLTEVLSYFTLSTSTASSMASSMASSGKTKALPAPRAKTPKGLHDEKRKTELYDEQKKIGLHDEKRKIGLYDEKRKIGLHDEKRKIGLHDEKRKIGLHDEKRKTRYPLH